MEEFGMWNPFAAKYVRMYVLILCPICCADPLDRCVRFYVEAGILRSWFSGEAYKIRGQRRAKSVNESSASSLDEENHQDDSALSYFVIVVVGNGLGLVVFLIEMKFIIRNSWKLLWKKLYCTKLAETPRFPIKLSKYVLEG